MRPSVARTREELALAPLKPLAISSERACICGISHAASSTTGTKANQVRARPSRPASKVSGMIKASATSAMRDCDSKAISTLAT